MVSYNELHAFHSCLSAIASLQPGLLELVAMKFVYHCQLAASTAITIRAYFLGKVG